MVFTYCTRLSVELIQKWAKCESFCVFYDVVSASVPEVCSAFLFGYAGRFLATPFTHKDSCSLYASETLQKLLLDTVPLGKRGINRSISEEAASRIFGVE